MFLFWVITEILTKTKKMPILAVTTVSLEEYLLALHLHIKLYALAESWKVVRHVTTTNNLDHIEDLCKHY